METLEIELSYIQRLVYNEEVEDVIFRHCDWVKLEQRSKLFGHDISDITRPLDILPDLVMRVADETLPAEKAQRFKAAWQELTPSQQMQIAIQAWQPL